jgi:hypothetical protein
MPKAVCDRSKATNKAAVLAKLVAAATGTETNPSGMCMKIPISFMWFFAVLKAI